ncbi:uncharacterized protein E5676_scaffold261G00500 [Cucumis melo var. makuwa]|uniref:Retrotransposon gag domain-containing protein n=1 Tax=Cucumis melo var. makuwa TaxID=1194695 RepID=A0A5D3B8N5_CUCMM|nr:uncharacterized protein E5676_scaffold261G00500 [Cucumis melo var. makuwa]
MNYKIFKLYIPYKSLLLIHRLGKWPEGSEDWWISYVARVGGVDFIILEGFRRGFQEKFYPRSFVDVKRKEFLCLVQDDMTVAEYEKKFTELAKYTIIFIIDEENKWKCFEGGLQMTIQTSATVSANWSDFFKLIKAAMRIERCLAKGD